jgi:hypothetical protein
MGAPKEGTMSITRIIVAAALGSMPAMAVAPASAERAAYWYLQPRVVFLEVYIYACEPVEYSFAGAKPELTEAGAEMYRELFIKKYASSCRDFYFEEISFLQHMVPPARAPLVAGK